jgi:hypothetical protein
MYSLVIGVDNILRQYINEKNRENCSRYRSKILGKIKGFCFLIMVTSHLIKNVKKIGQVA